MISLQKESFTIRSQFCGKDLHFQHIIFHLFISPGHSMDPGWWRIRPRQGHRRLGPAHRTRQPSAAHVVRHRHPARLPGRRVRHISADQLHVDLRAVLQRSM